MRFHGADDAYGWYVSRRFELSPQGTLPSCLYSFRPAAETAIALADLERMLARLGRCARLALRHRGAGYPAAAARFEEMLRQGSYLTH